MFAVSHHMGKCMTNFPLASYVSHIANFISHGEMHKEFPIRFFFCLFIYQLWHLMRKCMKNFSLLCICHFLRSTFTLSGEVHWEFAFSFLFACSYYQLWLGEKNYHLWNLPQRIRFDWPHLRYTTKIYKFTIFFTLSLGLLSPPNLSFSDIYKVKKFLLSLSMKCWNSVRNAKSQHNTSTCRRSENIAVEVPRIKEVKGETQKIVKIDGFQRFPPHPSMLMCFLARFLWISPYLWPNSKYWCCFFMTLRIPPLCINILDLKG
jgi:hypothetical protein